MAIEPKRILHCRLVFWADDDDEDQTGLKIINADGENPVVGAVFGDDDGAAERIQLCLNACAMMSNEELEKMGVDTVKQMVDAGYAEYNPQTDRYTIGKSAK